MLCGGAAQANHDVRRSPQELQTNASHVSRTLAQRVTTRLPEICKYED
jgi:hypothetical protein